MNEPELIDVLPAHRFDEAALARYLREHLPQIAEGIAAGLARLAQVAGTV